MVYICALPTSSTIVLDVSVPGLLSSTVRCLLYILHHIPFRQQQYVITTMFDDVLQSFCFRCFSGVPARRLNLINVSVKYNGGLLLPTLYC